MGLTSLETLTHLAPLIYLLMQLILRLSIVKVEDVFVLVDKRPTLEPFKGLFVFFYGKGMVVYTFQRNMNGFVHRITNLEANQALASTTFM